MTEFLRQQYLREAQVHLARAAQALAYAEDRARSERVLTMAREVQAARREPAVVEV